MEGEREREIERKRNIERDKDIIKAEREIHHQRTKQKYI